MNHEKIDVHVLISYYQKNTYQLRVLITWWGACNWLWGTGIIELVIVTNILIIKYSVQLFEKKNKTFYYYNKYNNDSISYKLKL